MCGAVSKKFLNGTLGASGRASRGAEAPLRRHTVATLGATTCPTARAGRAGGPSATASTGRPGAEDAAILVRLTASTNVSCAGSRGRRRRQATARKRRRRIRSGSVTTEGPRCSPSRGPPVATFLAARFSGATRASRPRTSAPSRALAIGSTGVRARARIGRAPRTGRLRTNDGGPICATWVTACGTDTPLAAPPAGGDADVVWRWDGGTRKAGLLTFTRCATNGVKKPDVRLVRCTMGQRRHGGSMTGRCSAANRLLIDHWAGACQCHGDAPGTYRCRAGRAYGAGGCSGATSAEVKGKGRRGVYDRCVCKLVS